MKMRNRVRRTAALLLAAVLLCLTACSGGTTAAAMHLRRTEGTVAVSDGNGKDVPVLDNLDLYSGYGVGTRMESYAWIDLDDVKLVKMDQSSEIVIEKEGKALHIEVKSGSLYFNVTEPLADDEIMDIRTSTMLIGIRGACGWVEDNGGLSRVHLLEGKAECSARGRTVQVSAGEMGSLTEDGDLAVEPFDAKDIPVFVLDDLTEDPDLCASILEASGLDVLRAAGKGEAAYEPDNANALIEALRAAQGGEIIRLADDFTESVIEDVDVFGGSADNPIILDLNGHNAASTTRPINIHGALQIRDNGTGYGSLHALIYVQGPGYLSLESGGLGNSNVYIFGNAAFIMNGGTLRGAISMTRNSEDVPVFIMNGGEIYCGGYATTIQNGGGRLELNGGTIINDYTQTQLDARIFAAGNSEYSPIIFGDTVIRSKQNRFFMSEDYAGLPDGLTVTGPDADGYYYLNHLGSSAPGADASTPRPEATQPPESTQPPETTQPPESAQPSAPATLPADGNRIVFTGTINRYTYDGVLALQGIPDPNPGSSAYFPGYAFRLIVLDTPQTMNLVSGDGQSRRSGTVSIIDVSYVSGLEQYDGQRLIFSIDPSQTWWPSGTDLPLGEPSTDNIHVLGTAP